MKLKIAPSIMDADLLRLGEVLEQLEQAGADLFHVDVMDGHYVPSMVGCTRIVAAIKRLSSVPVDAHLMVSNPYQAVRWFLEAGADILIFHPDAAEAPEAIIEDIHKAGRLAGVALKPDKPAGLIRSLAREIDCVMVMTVSPGFSGQAFLESACEKIPELRRMCRAGIDVYVDGGINTETAPIAVRYGANVMAAASAIFASDVAPAKALERLRRAAEGALKT